MNRKRISIMGVILLITCLILFVIFANKSSGLLVYNPSEKGIVPDEATAIKIAETVGLPVFGKNLNDYMPFHASLKNDSIWHVYGLPKKTLFSVQLGGCPDFEIQKKDGKVLKISITR